MGGCSSNWLKSGESSITCAKARTVNVPAPVILGGTAKKQISFASLQLIIIAVDFLRLLLA
jgi:hypothetical protein